MRIVIEWPPESELPTRVYIDGAPKRTGGGRKIVAQTKLDRAATMYREGVPVLEIADYLDRSHSQTKVIIGRLIPNAERRTPRAAALVYSKGGRKFTVSPEMIAKAVAQYKSGAAMAVIAHGLRVSERRTRALIAPHLAPEERRRHRHFYSG